MSIEPVHPAPPATGPATVGPHLQPSELVDLLRLGGVTRPGHATSPVPAPPHAAPPIVDGPAPGDGRVLPALQAALREGLVAVPLDSLVRRIEAIPLLAPVLPPDPTTRLAHLTAALGWLVDHLDQPAVVATRLAELGPGLHELGYPPVRLELLSAAIIEALRLGMPIPPAKPEHHDAWRLTGELAVRWIGQGAQAGAYEPPYWTGVVHAVDSAPVTLIRTLLPYRHTVGQYAPLEQPGRPGTWLPYWIANPPAGDNLLELHIPGPPFEIGERVKLREPHVGLDTPGPGPLLLVAEGTGVAAFKAMLAEPRRRRSPAPVDLYWLATDHYDDSLAALARLHAVPAAGADEQHGSDWNGVEALVNAVTFGGPWTDREVCVSAAPATVEAVVAALSARGVPASRVRVAHSSSS